MLIETYADAFGPDAADAFGKAIRAWHACIEVAAEQRVGAPDGNRKARNHQRGRVSSCLPVPKPLRSSVKAGAFGEDERGRLIRPSAAEVRAITEQQVERMVGMKDDEMALAVVKYAEDFGNKAAAQLERYVRLQQRSR